MMTTAVETPGKPNALRATVSDLANLLSDFWFGMLLLAIWGVMTTIGVIVDQQKDPTVYFTSYPAPLARLVLRLHLDNIYHSPAYVGMIGLIVSTMTFATFRSVIPRRMPALRPVKIDVMPLHAFVSIPGDEPSVRERIAAYFASHGWSIRKREFGGDEWTFVDKHNWARRGVLVAHVGFIVIAIGTTMYWAGGYSGTTAVISGDSTTIPQNGTTIKLNSFAYKIDPIQTKAGTTYQPIDYVSQVTVTPKGGKPYDAVIRVNHPLDVNGTLYYQSTYGFAIAFSLTKDGKPLPTSPTQPLREGEAFQVDTTHAIQYAQFIGTIDRKTGGAARDPRPNDPGVVINAFDGDQLLGRSMIPLGSSLDLGDGFRLAASRYILYSGFQYRHDPGIPIVGLGAFVLVAGLCISFYFLPARLYVRTTSQPDGTVQVGIAATTVKGYDIYEERFAELVNALRRTPMAA
jgi:cytochrome c biogenesis protein